MEGRQMMGTKSWEAEAQGGRPGGGLGGMGEVPHITLSCSSVTYLREEQPQEGIQTINGSRIQEMALTMGEGKGRTVERPTLGESQHSLSKIFSLKIRRQGLPLSGL